MYLIEDAMGRVLRQFRPLSLAALVRDRQFRGYRTRMILVHRIIQLIQLDTPARFPGEGRDPLLPWAPAFAGVAGLVWAMARHCLMNRVNDSLH
jgi:hypothetical protein